MAVHDYFHAVLDLFYPRTCLHCNRNLNHSRELCICKDCRKTISYTGNTHCVRCGAGLGIYTSSTLEEGCFACKGKHLPFHAVTSVTHYKGAVRTLIHQFKYTRLKFLAPVLNDIVTAHETLIDAVSTIDVIVPVPLHWLKKLRRGFNQSELLSRGIHRHFSIPMSTNNLCRVKNTDSQTHLTKSQRQVNIRDAFFVKRPEAFRGKRVLLVDDVLTTGVTVSECARKLKKAGAASVHVFILAIAEYHR